MNILQALSNVEIKFDGITLHKGTLVGLIAKIDSLDTDTPPQESLEITVGSMYDVRMFRDKTTVAMDVNVDELTAAMTMVSEALGEWGDDSFKPLTAIIPACIPTRIEGSYRAIYPDGEVTVDGNRISGHISFPMGLDHINAQIRAQEDRLAALNADLATLRAEFHSGEEGLDGQ